MKVRVDRERCQGHNRCFAICPEVFQIDDEGKAVVTDEQVPAELEAKARRAAESCPEEAIEVGE